MERLTERLAYGWTRIIGKKISDHCGDFPCKDVGGCERAKDRTCPWIKAVDRLAAYEDTDLEPEEIKDVIALCQNYTTAGLDAKFIQACIDIVKSGVPLDHLRELTEADKDGRLVVLPCSLGKKVWSGKWRDDLSECVYVCASSMLSDIERGNVIRYTRKAAEAALKAGDTP